MKRNWKILNIRTPRFRISAGKTDLKSMTKRKEKEGKHLEFLRKIRRLVPDEVRTNG